MVKTFVLEAAINETGMSESVQGGGFLTDADVLQQSSRPVRLFVLERATDTLPRALDFDRYGFGTWRR